MIRVLSCFMCFSNVRLAKIELGMFTEFVKVLSNMALGTNIRLLQMEICSLMNEAMVDGREGK